MCVHFSVKPKDGMIETEDIQQTLTNLFVEIEADKLSSFPVRGKILVYSIILTMSEANFK